MSLKNFIMKQFVRKCSCQCHPPDVKYNPYVIDKIAVESGYRFFKNITYFMAIPATLICAAYQIKYYQHPKRIPFVPYEHMYIMHKPFFWGDGKHTLFFNKRINATIEGYETEDEESKDE